VAVRDIPAALQTFIIIDCELLNLSADAGNEGIIALIDFYISVL
jgi:hypothetical protein